jgi:hypothetical protein
VVEWSECLTVDPEDPVRFQTISDFLRSGGYGYSYRVRNRQRIRLIKMCLNEIYNKVRIGKYLSDSFPMQNSLK